MPASSAPPAHIEVLERFVELLHQVEHEGEHPAFYGRLVEAICQLSDMRRGIAIRYDPGSRRVRIVGGWGIDYAEYLDVPLSIESASLARDALLRDRVLEARPPFAGQVPDSFLSLADQGPLVCVPMCANGLMIGVVLAQRPADAPPLGDEAGHRLWTLGKTAALAAAARIATHQQSRSRALQERIDLARDLHDRVVQRLFGVLLTLSATADKDLPAADRARCAGEVQDALRDLRAALERPLGRELAPTTSTLAEEVARLGGEGGPGFAVRVQGDPAVVPAELEALAQAVLAEAVANAAKHARPTAMDISVRRDDDAFVLEVCNDGVGDAPARSGASTGMGLRLAAHAALQLGGLVEHGRRPDGRWQVRLVVGGGR